MTNLKEERLYDPAIETAKTLVTQPWGALETGANLFSQIYGLPAMGLAGIAGLPFGKSREWGEAVGKGLIYQPQTEAGRKITEATFAPFELLSKASERVADVAREAKGRPSPSEFPWMAEAMPWGEREPTEEERAMAGTVAGTAVMSLPLLFGLRRHGARPQYPKVPSDVITRMRTGEGTVLPAEPTAISPIPRLPAIRPTTEPVPTPLPLGIRPPMAEVSPRVQELPLHEPPPVQKMRKIESGVVRMPTSEWTKNPELVAEAKLASEKTGISPENLEYVGLQKFTPYSNDAMHLWNVTDPSSPKYKSTVAGPTFQLTEGQTKRLRPLGILKSERGSLGGEVKPGTPEYTALSKEAFQIGQKEKAGTATLEDLARREKIYEIAGVTKKSKSARTVEDIQDEIEGFTQELEYHQQNLLDAIGDVEAQASERGNIVSSKAEITALKKELKAILKGQRGSLGEGKPVPMWYSTLQRTIEDKMPNSAPVEQVKAILNTPGIKVDEIKWTGLDDFLASKTGKVSKQDVMEHLRNNKVKVEEVTKGVSAFKVVSHPEFPDKFALQKPDGSYVMPSPDSMYANKPSVWDTREMAERYGIRSHDVSATKFAQWQLPGGENYRELLLTLPERSWRETKVGPQVAIEPISPREPFRAPHWDEPNVLAHVRFNDRMDSQGKKVLFIEEVQSDWHQVGREKGYVPSHKQLETNRQRLIEIRDEINVLAEKGRAKGLQGVGDDVILQEDFKKYLDLHEEGDRLQLPGQTKGVPEAPFSKTWHELMMKRMVRWASEKGYDKVAWTTGEQQAARYDLSKQVDAINYEKLPSGNYNIGVTKGGRDLELPKTTNIDPKGLADLVGKEIAQKIINDQGKKIYTTGWKELTGLDLKVGGEGMKGFYDKILPEYMNKFGKKWGAKVGETTFPERIKQDILSTGEAGGTYQEIPKTTVHSLDITPSMKSSVLEEGLPLFQLLPLAGAGAGGLAYMGKKKSQESK